MCVDAHVGHGKVSKSPFSVVPGIEFVTDTFTLRANLTNPATKFFKDQRKENW